MDGRVYDPSIGRFLSADSNIQAPYSTQSYNRYSYVINNPLKYTDPDGYFFVKPLLVRAGMMGSSGSLARQSPWRLCPKAVYAMRSTMLPCPLVICY
jgi:hypothetical protein